jgi:hypothetical protein
MGNLSETFNFTVDTTQVVQLTHPGDSSVQQNISDKLKGDGYYGRSDGFHTVQYNLTGLLGSLVVQGTLASTPADEDWVTLPLTLHESEISDDNSRNGSFIYNFTGNFVWVRINVYNWTDGTVKSVLLNH